MTNNPVAQPTGAGDAETVWRQVRDSLNREGAWTLAEVDVFRGFFISGWNHRGMVDMLNAAAPDSSITEKAARATQRIINGLPYEVAQHVNRQLLTTIITTEFQK